MSPTGTTSDERNVTTFNIQSPSQGAAAALAWLNAGRPHRYSIIQRFQQREFVNSSHMTSKSNPCQRSDASSSFDWSLCRFMLRDGMFSTKDSVSDVRLNGRSHQGIAIGYPGTSIANDTEEELGTMRHFEMVRRSRLDSQYALLPNAARTLPR